MPSFTIATYNSAFYSFFVMNSNIQSGEFLTIDLQLLSSNVPTRDESFNNHKSFGLHHLREYTSELMRNADLNYLTDQDIHNGLIFIKIILMKTYMIFLFLVIQNMLLKMNTLIIRNLWRMEELLYS